MTGVPPLRQAMTGAAYAFANRSVVPLIGEETDDGVSLEGTGTLFRFEESYVVVTAEHVPRNIPDHRPGLAIGDSDAEIWRPRSTDVYSAGDPYDIAVIHLKDPDLVTALKRTREFLTLDNLLLRDSPALDDFYVHGFPRQMAQLDGGILAVTPFSFTAPRYRGPIDVEGVSVPVDRHKHLLVRMAGDEIDAGGETAQVPDLAGISGCSIWANQVPSDTGRVWTPHSDLKVIAVQTSVLRNRWIRGTKWAFLSSALRKIEPSLGPALEAAMRGRG